MQEYDIDDIQAATTYAWHTHDWTGQEAEFAGQVLMHGDATRAYVAAFGKDINRKDKRYLIAASKHGQDLLNQPFMKSYVQFIRDKIKEKMQVTSERVLEELAILAYSNMADFAVIEENGQAVTDLSGLTREQWAAVSEMTVGVRINGTGDDKETVKETRIKLTPKVAALELLGKHLKLFTEVRENHDMTVAEDELISARRRIQERRQAENQGDGNE